MRDVDFLLLIDNSNSTLEKQELLAAHWPRLVEALLTGDVGDDGQLDYEPVDSIQFGVVTPDMGSLGNDVPGCLGRGDDGLLISSARSRHGCEYGTANVLTIRRADGAEAWMRGADDLSCMTVIDQEGCGFEQPLEALWRATDPAGHGSGANADLFRDEALLVWLPLMDEDDCSAPQRSADIFSLEEDGAFADEPLNLRCYLHEDDGTLFPLERYADGLRDAKGDGRFLYAPFVGIPPSVDGEPATSVLEHPLMSFVPDGPPDGRDTLATPSCDTSFGQAHPPRRLVKLAELLGGDALPRSWCLNSLDPAIDDLAREILERRAHCSD